MGRKFEDLTGKSFGKLKVLYENGRTKSGDILWLCECECTNVVPVTASNLRTGHTKSCGCLVIEKQFETHKKYNKYDLTGDYGIGYTSKGEEFYFDLEDYDLIKDHCWYINARGYVVTQTDNDKQVLYLHRVVTNAKENEVVDHKFGSDYLYDNRKCKLRCCTQSNNLMNRVIGSNNNSGISGVCYSKERNKWRAYITVNRKQIYLGMFINKEDAIQARLNAEIKYFGEYSYIESRCV